MNPTRNPLSTGQTGAHEDEPHPTNTEFTSQCPQVSLMRLGRGAFEECCITPSPMLHQAFVPSWNSACGRGRACAVAIKQHIHVGFGGGDLSVPLILTSVHCSDGHSGRVAASSMQMNSHRDWFPQTVTGRATSGANRSDRPGTLWVDSLPESLPGSPAHKRNFALPQELHTSSDEHQEVPESIPSHCEQTYAGQFPDIPEYWQRSPLDNCDPALRRERKPATSRPGPPGQTQPPSQNPTGRQSVQCVPAECSYAQDHFNSGHAPGTVWQSTEEAQQSDLSRATSWHTLTASQALVDVSLLMIFS
jgi:hypothetical protein